VEIKLHGYLYMEWDTINKIWMQHATAQQIKKYYCTNFEDYFSFAFTRNPWDRAISDYFWMQSDLGIGDTFRNWLLLQNRFNIRRLKQPPESSHTRADHLLNQCDFILDEDDISMVNFIGKVENLQEDFNTVCDKIGIPRQQLPHKNKTEHKHYTEYYDEETRQIVAEKYAKDIEHFGYKFGE
jgi:hypothetical protein